MAAFLFLVGPIENKKKKIILCTSLIKPSNILSAVIDHYLGELCEIDILLHFLWMEPNKNFIVDVSVLF